jgi:hypothetical protein
MDSMMIATRAAAFTPMPNAHGQLVANDWGGLIILVVEDGGVKK